MGSSGGGGTSPGPSKPSSVMVHVATGGGTGQAMPMLLRLPIIGDAFDDDYQMLGFGDIAIPGLLVAYLLRFDVANNKRWGRGYFGPSVMGYGVGMVATFVALFNMQKAQPALLYLVPCTLGVTFFLACIRREFGIIWRGQYIP